MIAFVDASVVLRLLFEEPGQLPEWDEVDVGYGSRLLRLEIARVIDRNRLLGRIVDDDVARLGEDAEQLISGLEVVAMNDDILDAAARPMPTVVGSLDAIHLATALEVKRRLAPTLCFATHDAQLATAARACGFHVVGVERAPLQ